MTLNTFWKENVDPQGQLLITKEELADFVKDQIQNFTEGLITDPFVPMEFIYYIRKSSNAFIEINLTNITKEI